MVTFERHTQFPTVSIHSANAASSKNLRRKHWKMRKVARAARYTGRKQAFVVDIRQLKWNRYSPSTIFTEFNRHEFDLPVDISILHYIHSHHLIWWWHVLMKSSSCPHLISHRLISSRIFLLFSSVTHEVQFRSPSVWQSGIWPQLAGSCRQDLSEFLFAGTPSWLLKQLYIFMHCKWLLMPNI